MQIRVRAVLLEPASKYHRDAAKVIETCTCSSKDHAGGVLGSAGRRRMAMDAATARRKTSQECAA
jgi:hypothetical protein